MKIKSIEKLIIVVVAFLAVSRIGVFLKDLYFAYYIGVEGPTLQQKILSQHISFILFSIVNVGSSIWLYVESRKAEMKTWIWTIFGLFFGLMAVAIFYLSGIYGNLKHDERQRHD